jgi:FKBP-type peptidyl-prolyl cis-trans isomerase
VIPDIEAYEQASIDSYMDTVAVSDTIHDPIADVVMYYMIDHATDGKAIGLDSVVTIAYKGYLADGRVFDERSAEDSTEFTVGAEIIPGWALGLQRMKNGEKGRFVIPYELAYGEEGQKDSQNGLRTIPPYETLYFDLEILSVNGASLDDGDSAEQ